MLALPKVAGSSAIYAAGASESSSELRIRSLELPGSCRRDPAQTSGLVHYVLDQKSERSLGIVP